MKLGECVDEIVCETCDDQGHIVGDVWNVGPCEKCECSSDLTTRCVVTECPEPPICNEKETLEKLTKPANACCEAFHCGRFSIYTSN
ncbi:SCO-spondin [Trichonephila inaurata madagascariensis]|uniref:SCO-spondin n=1 Tax=Trichonephila inaurata madagascariensis TaxID=2747483 RepID=A0A8X7BZK9_9ARAC|nr:SCO-spondin [Trichonephila inaurata madagascariensis]